MSAARAAAGLLLAGLLSSCGVTAQSTPSKIDLRTPTSTPTPQVSQHNCPPKPTVTAASSASPTSSSAITVPCDKATAPSDPSTTPPPADRAPVTPASPRPS